MPNSVVIKANQGTPGADAWPVEPTTLPPDAATDSTLAQMASDLAASMAALQAAIEANQTVAVAGVATLSAIKADVDKIPANPAQDGTEITGASMPAGGAGLRGWLSAIYTKLAASIAVTVVSLPLPSGAATSAKQPALGTAGTASADVISVQGISGGVAQPVSGTVTTNVGTGTRATSVADGGNVALGTTTDASTATTVIGRLQKLISLLPTATTGAGSLKVAPVEGLYQSGVTLQTASTGQTGPGTPMDVSGLVAVGIQIAGTSSSVLSHLEGTINGTDWITLPATNRETGTVYTSFLNLFGLFFVPVAGLTQIRTPIDVINNGTLVITAHGVTGGDAATGNSIMYGNVGGAPTALGAVATFSTPALRVALHDYLGAVLAAVASTGYTAFTYALNVAPSLFNGLTMDTQRSKMEATLLSSAARTTTANSSDQTDVNGRGLLLIVNISSAGIGSVTPTLQIKDSISGNYFTIWTATALLVANGTYAYQFYPGAADAGSYTESKQLMLARTWRVSVIANNVNSVTYSVSAVVLV